MFYKMKIEKKFLLPNHITDVKKFLSTYEKKYFQETGLLLKIFSCKVLSKNFFDDNLLANVSLNILTYKFTHDSIYTGIVEEQTEKYIKIKFKFEREFTVFIFKEEFLENFIFENNMWFWMFENNRYPVINQKPIRFRFLEMNKHMIGSIKEIGLGPVYWW